MFSKNFDHKNLESKWYDFWEKMEYFSPNGNGKPFCIMIPPPNITGNLHMGHAYQNTIIDSIIRYYRMKGYKVLWQMGTDHAGIATQMLLENKILKEKNKKREDLEKNEFLMYISNWKKQSIKNISYQMRHLGSSVDWKRSRFTMDEGLSNSVKTAFIKLYEEGIIYKGKKLVNWDTQLKTAISDLEINKVEKKNKLYFLLYKLQGINKYIEIATTRPETIFGDVAIAVNPKDDRYNSFIGIMAIVPIINKTIPIISDKNIDMKFGSGCVKITPAHDFNDFEIGKKNKLKIINIMNKDGTLNNNVHPNYVNLNIKDARKKILLELIKIKMLSKVKIHDSISNLGDRSNSVIEPLLTNQWFIKTNTLSSLSISAVEKNIIKFIPETWSKIYFNWMHKLDDWCISRQIWWGHQIPAWYDSKNNVFVGHSEKEVRKKYRIMKEENLIRETDVLDTWFSSALWPFATLGWPYKTTELKEFYPTNILVTGFDIIFYWVARMIMFGIKFTKTIPFKYVYIHGLIRDGQGQKMSKSKGNIIDPLDLIKGISLDRLLEKRVSNLMQENMKHSIINNTKKEFPNGIKSYGTDALRLTLLSVNSASQFLKFEISNLEKNRNFCNKLWNASRYVISSIKNYKASNKQTKNKHIINIWIISIWEQYKNRITRSNREYRFDLSVKYLISFFKEKFCDWYLEFSKYLLIKSSKIYEETASTMLRILEEVLKVLHPYAPFITEELWQKIKILVSAKKESIMVLKYPNLYKKNISKKFVLKVEFIKNFIRKIRIMRLQLNIKNNIKILILVSNINIYLKSILEKNYSLILYFTKSKNIFFIKNSAKLRNVGHSFINDINLYIPLIDLKIYSIDNNETSIKLKKLEKMFQMNLKKINNPDYIKNAPKIVIDKTRKKLLSLKNKIDNIKLNVISVN